MWNFKTHILAIFFFVLNFGNGFISLVYLGAYCTPQQPQHSSSVFFHRNMRPSCLMVYVYPHTWSTCMLLNRFKENDGLGPICVRLIYTVYRGP